MALSKIPSAGFQDNVKFRNIFINGDMSIAQRGTSESGITGSGYYTVDRWKTSISSLGTWTQTQSTDVPSGQGFAKSLKLDCTTADASPSADNVLFFQQAIEGQNLQYLKFGTSNAQQLTLSFWVKTNKTGTYICEIINIDSTTSVSKSYTINSANTWEKKTINIPADTSNGFDNDNADSLRVYFWLGAGTNYTSGTLNTSWNSFTTANRAVGQVNLADSTSNEWYITGVQLEAGTTASDFEFLPYDVNLNRCHRYYQFIVSGTGKAIGDGGAYSTSNAWSFVHTKPFRVKPSIDIVTGTNYYSFIGNATSFSVSNVFLEGNSSANVIRVANTSVSVTQGRSYLLATANSNAFIGFDAEL